MAIVHPITLKAAGIDLRKHWYSAVVGKRRNSLQTIGGKTMEKSTSLTFLYYKAAGEQEFTKLVDITSYPDIYTKPEKLDVSTLSSNQKKYTEGMVDTPDYDFGFIYSKEAYQKIKALAGDNTIFFQLWFGEGGRVRQMAVDRFGIRNAVCW